MENLDLQKGNLQNKIKLKTKKEDKQITYLVFISVFIFLGFNPASMHVCSQTCPPLPNFFGQIMHLKCQLVHLQ
jgi:hypothetical protein